MTSPDCLPWQIKGYRPASKQDIEAAYYRAVAKGAIIEGEARYTTTTDQRSKDAPPLPAMTKAEWQAQLTDKKGMNNDQRRH
ncbi:hypothetical protein [Klebsiella pneumoniae]|uniref:hypothetical protein n=1 Tax=Klebsiella pneumoniae TaxID=573 RepID=UPI00388E83CF